MTKDSSCAWMGVAVAVAVAGLFYWLAIRPQRSENAGLRRQNESLETAVRTLENSLKSTPTLPEEERRLWPFIRRRLAGTLYEQDHVMAAMASVAATVRDSGARVVSALAEKLPEEAPPARPGFAPYPTAVPSAVPGAELEASVADRLEGEAAPARPQPRVAGDAPRQPLPSRRGPAPAAAQPGDGKAMNWPDLGREVVKHPVKMEIAGPYPAWVELFNRMSAAVTPALVERLEAVAGDGGGAMRVSLTVPLLAPGEGEPPPPETAVAVSGATRRRYFLSDLADPLPSPFPRAAGDPFRPRRPAATAETAPERKTLPRPTAILRRNGEAVAVFGTRVVRVGDDFEGYRVIAIREDAVFFQE